MARKRGQKSTLRFAQELRGTVDPRQSRVVRETWLEQPLGDGSWVAAYRLIPQQGRPVIAEVRVFPTEGGRRNAGRWSAERLGDEARVPTGGLNFRLLRDLKAERLREDLHKQREQFERLAKKWGRESIYSPTGFAGRHGFTEKVMKEAGRRPGRRGHSDLFYAEFAQAYVDQLAHGSRTPVEDVARARKYSPSYVRDVISAARRRGLLTPSSPGRADGEMTEKAKTVLLGEVGTRAPRRRGRSKR